MGSTSLLSLSSMVELGLTPLPTVAFKAEALGLEAGFFTGDFLISGAAFLTLPIADACFTAAAAAAAAAMEGGLAGGDRWGERPKEEEGRAVLNEGGTNTSSSSSSKRARPGGVPSPSESELSMR